MADMSDQVVKLEELPFMSSPFPMLAIIISYWAFVLKLGPMYMKTRPPFQLKNLLLLHNLFQVGYSIFLCTMGTLAILDYGLVESQKCYMGVPALKDRIMRAHYWYFIAKLTELLDTVLFVLRKKWKQVSFLHVYHHSVMFLATWITLKYEPSFSLVFLGTLNSFVHVVMYTYYGLSAFPELEKYLWWKKYITKLQLVQFLIVIIQITWNSVVSECPLSYILLTVCWVHAILFIYLFTDFYIKSYKQKRRESQASLQKENLPKVSHQNGAAHKSR